MMMMMMLTRLCVDNTLLPFVWFYGVMVSTLDFESSDPVSNLGRT